MAIGEELILMPTRAPILTAPNKGSTAFWLFHDFGLPVSNFEPVQLG